ncbi:MAG TPA: Spy/CpxP family protein refolding chaperone [Rhodanobacteraceae bacterium]
MRNEIISAAVLAVALACSPLAIAATTQTTSTTTTQTSQTSHHWNHHSHRGMHHWRHGHHDRMPLRQLDLTKAQRTAIHQLYKRDAKASHADFVRMRQDHRALAAATPGTMAYSNATKALASSAAAAASARVERQATLWANVYQQLTPAQRTKLASIKAQRKARMEKWRQSHHRAHTMATASSTH